MTAEVVVTTVTVTVLSTGVRGGEVYCGLLGVEMYGYNVVIVVSKPIVVVKVDVIVTGTVSTCVCTVLLGL